MIINILVIILTQLRSMIIIEKSISKYHIKKVLDKMAKLNKWQYEFIPKILLLFMSIKGKINFLQLERYSNSSEQHYRNQFEKEFDFLNFNKELILEHGGVHRILAFDPSYVSKSGKSTPGVGYFWSGCAGSCKWGLEIGGIGVIDLDNHTSFSLEAVQTPNKLDTSTLLGHYSNSLITRKEQLLQISKYLAADAYFSKAPFVKDMCDEGFELISRLRNDADLRYLYKGKKKGGRGRPKIYDGKIKYDEPSMTHLNILENTSDRKVYEGIVNSKSLKRNINLVIVYTRKDDDKWTHKLYFSTDLALDTKKVLQYYYSRFQIEFTYRDGKQNAGLNDCQARSENKLNFHFNTALTAVNIAKISHWLPIPKEQRGAFSMTNIKTMYNNQLLLEKFLCKFGIDPNTKKNKLRIIELTNYGTIAA